MYLLEWFSPVGNVWLRGAGCHESTAAFFLTQKESETGQNRPNFAGLGVNLQHVSLTAPWPHTYSLLLQIVRRLRRRPLQNKDQLPMACTLTWSRLEYFTPFNGKPKTRNIPPMLKKLRFGGVNCWDLEVWWIQCLRLRIRICQPPRVFSSNNDVGSASLWLPQKLSNFFQTPSSRIS